MQRVKGYEAFYREILSGFNDNNNTNGNGIEGECSTADIVRCFPDTILSVVLHFDEYEVDTTEGSNADMIGLTQHYSMGWDKLSGTGGIGMGWDKLSGTGRIGMGWDKLSGTGGID